VKAIVTRPDDDPCAAAGPAGAGGHALRRILPLAAVGCVAVLVLVMGWHRELSLETLIRHQAALERALEAHFASAVVSFVLLYIAVVALSIPGAVYLTVGGGVLFGGIIGGLASIAGATVGATILFLIARTAFGEPLVRRAGPLAARIAEEFREDAFHYLLFLRLVPAFPFFLVNLVPALCGVAPATFIAATAIGIVPATFAFAFVGAGLDSVLAAQKEAYQACLASGVTDCRLNFNLKAAITPELITALVALGLVALIPIALKRLRARRRIADPSS